MELTTFLASMNEKIKSRKYSRDMSILSFIRFGDKKLARIHFIRKFPNFQIDEMITRLQNVKLGLETEYDAVLNSEAMRVFNRPWLPSDYKISGIGCAEFSEDAKNILRHNQHTYNDVHDSIIVLNHVKKYGG